MASVLRSVLANSAIFAANEKSEVKIEFTDGAKRRAGWGRDTKSACVVEAAMATKGPCAAVRLFFRL